MARTMARMLAAGLLGAGLLTTGAAEPAQAQGAAPQDMLAAIKRDYRRPPPRPIDNQALVDLGRDLFFEPRISASGKTACANCHFPELGWVTDRAAATIPAS